MEKFKNMKNSKWSRVIAAALCMVLVLGVIFQANLFSAAEEKEKAARKETIAEESIERVADSRTMDDWQESFGTEEDTSNAGRIWTDKTVVDGDITLQTVDGETSAMVNRKDGEDSDNFMVALSALSSNKTVTGESAAPVDVVFVLDISASMYNVSPDGKQKIAILIEAANETIDRILKLNTANRVSVILYCGATGTNDNSPETTATCPLPLDSYKSMNGQYLLLLDNGRGIEVADGVINSSGEEMPPEGRRVTGYTYIQNGLMKALNQFTDAADGTDERIPVIALMSDGAPTAANTKYTQEGESNVGVGDITDIRTTFLTQLTASWIKEKVNHLYQKTPLFFSVGLAVEDNDYANMVLNPSERTDNELDAWWNQFFESNVRETGVIYTPKDQNRTEIEIIKADDLITDRYYVDRFFNANNAEELNQAFEDIIEEIRLQSGYYPTDADRDNANYSGYLVFKDEIGQYMRVEYMNGVMYNGTLYDGSEFASEANNGNIEEFLDSLVERLNIDMDEARELLDNALEHGQISYKSETEFSNYIGWYSDENGNYLGWYSESGTGDTTVPEGAVYANKSYFYYGESSGTVTGANLMYLGVRVMERLSNGRQTVQLSIPASLVPIVRYDVITQTDSDQQETDTTTKNLAYPMRLFYEVGLEGGINEYDLSAVSDDYSYKKEDETSRTYYFYSNAWNTTNNTKNAETKVTFSPSKENEFYYYTSDTPIYVKSQESGDGFQLYDGESHPEGTCYYKKPVYNLAGGKADKYIEITSAALGKAIRQENGGWCIPKETSKYNEGDYIKNKEDGNPTQTADYSRMPRVNLETGTSGTSTNMATSISKSVRDLVSIEVLLGNNGRIGITQGRLRGAKVVLSEDVPEGDENRAFDFVMTLDESSSTGKIIGEKDGQEVEFPINQDGTISFQLKDKESILFYLPIGRTVSIEEINASEYSTQMTVAQNGTEETHEDTKNSGPVIIMRNSVSSVTAGNIWGEPAELLNLSKGTSSPDGNDDTTQPLKGAIFDIYELICKNPAHTDETHMKIIDDNYKDENIESPCWKFISETTSGPYGGISFIDPNTGTTLFFKKGTYRLIEVKAPEGYTKPIAQWNIEVTPGGAAPFVFKEVLGNNGERPPAIINSAENEFVLMNYKPLNPPITGGRGITGFIVIGLGMMISASLFGVHLILQKKRGKL